MNGKNAFEHGGNVHAVWREKQNKSQPLLDFSANINPLGLSDNVRKAILGALETVVHYPDPSAYELKQAISRFYNVPKQYITLGNGAVEPLYILCQTLRPGKVLVTAPTFGEYERAALAAKAEVEALLLSAHDNFVIYQDQILLRLAAVDIVFITNPNNPTGTLMSCQNLEGVIAAADEADTLVVVDESFIDFLPDGEKYTVKPLLVRYKNLVVVQSLTKFYAIPGLRLGFVLSNEAIAKQLDLAKDPWNVNSLAQVAGVAALKDTRYQTEAVSYMAKANMALYQALNGLQGIKAFKPSANFLLLDIKGTGLKSGQLCKLAAKHNILLRDCSNYQGLSDAYIRVAVKGLEDNERLVEVLHKIIQGDSR